MHFQAVGPIGSCSQGLTTWQLQWNWAWRIWYLPYGCMITHALRTYWRLGILSSERFIWHRALGPRCGCGVETAWNWHTGEACWWHHSLEASKQELVTLSEKQAYSLKTVASPENCVKPLRAGLSIAIRPSCIAHFLEIPPSLHVTILRTKHLVQTFDGQQTQTLSKGWHSLTLLSKQVLAISSSFLCWGGRLWSGGGETGFHVKKSGLQIRED